MQKKDVSVTFCNFSSKYVTSASKLFLFSNETHYYTHVALTLRFTESRLYLYIAVEKMQFCHSQCYVQVIKNCALNDRCSRFLLHSHLYSSSMDVRFFKFSYMTQRNQEMRKISS